MSETLVPIVTPPVGWRVLYYRDVNRRHAFPATVIEKGEHGAVRLNVEERGRIRHHAKFVRHTSDVHLKQFPDEIHKVGYWEYIVQQEYKPTAEEVAAEEAFVKRRKEAFEAADARREKAKAIKESRERQRAGQRA